MPMPNSNQLRAAKPNLVALHDSLTLYQYYGRNLQVLIRKGFPGYPLDG